MMKKQIYIIVLACGLLAGCAGYLVNNPDGTTTERLPENVINDTLQEVAPGFGPWGYAIAALSAAVTGLIGKYRKRPGEDERVMAEKFASYNAGVELGASMMEPGTIGEPGDGNEHDERPVIGAAKGPE